MNHLSEMLADTIFQRKGKYETNQFWKLAELFMRVSPRGATPFQRSSPIEQVISNREKAWDAEHPLFCRAIAAAGYWPGPGVKAGQRESYFNYGIISPDHPQSLSSPRGHLFPYWRSPSSKLSGRRIGRSFGRLLSSPSAPFGCTAPLTSFEKN